MFRMLWFVLLASLCCLVFLFRNIVSINRSNKTTKALTSLHQRVYNGYGWFLPINDKVGSS